MCHSSFVLSTLDVDLVVLPSINLTGVRLCLNCTNAKHIECVSKSVRFNGTCDLQDAMHAVTAAPAGLRR